MIRFATSTYARGVWSDELPGELDSGRTLVLAFGASSFLDAPDVFREIAQAFPTGTVVGCSTAGEIHGSKILDDSLVVTAIRFETTQIRKVDRRVDDVGATELGREIARELAAPDLACVLVLSDGLGVNGSDLTRGLRDVLGTRAPITGGLAGDGDRFGRTWVLERGIPRESVVTAVGLYGGATRVAHGSKGGWDIFGPERIVTRSRGNVLFELDGKPALDLYQRYLGERASGLPATALLFPLAVRPRSGGAPLVRTVLSVDPRERSMTFAGDIEQGFLAQLMRANLERLLQGAAQAAGAALGSTQCPAVCISISCVGRRLVLGQRAEEELEAVLDVLPAGVHQIGFYSYGEISPHADGGCELHNQTMTLTTLGED